MKKAIKAVVSRLWGAKKGQPYTRYFRDVAAKNKSLKNYRKIAKGKIGKRSDQLMDEMRAGRQKFNAGKFNDAEMAKYRRELRRASRKSPKRTSTKRNIGSRTLRNL